MRDRWKNIPLFFLVAALVLLRALVSLGIMAGFVLDRVRCSGRTRLASTNDRNYSECNRDGIRRAMVVMTDACWLVQRTRLWGGVGEDGINAKKKRSQQNGSRTDERE